MCFFRGVESLSVLFFQPSFFSGTRAFQQPRVFGGFLERRIAGRNGEATSRSLFVFGDERHWNILDMVLVSSEPEVASP